VFIRQARWEVEENQNWMEVAANLGQTMGLPRWCQLWIYPVDNQIVKLGSEDKAYSFDCVENKQYWWDMHYDPAFDPGDTAHAVLMVHVTGRAEWMPVSKGAKTDGIVQLR
jgi:hypothetical protein